MKLHSSPTSPFVRMVLVTAHEVGLIDKITLMDAGSVPPTEVHAVLTADNPLGKIPCLVTDHGHALYDSRVICEYLAHHGGRELFPDEPVKRFRVLTLQALAQGICDAGVSYRYEIAARPKEARWPAWADRQLARIAASLDEMERGFAPDLGEVSIGTIAAACALGYMEFRFADRKYLETRPNLAAFYRTFSGRPSMAATAPS